MGEVISTELIGGAAAPSSCSSPSGRLVGMLAPLLVALAGLIFGLVSIGALSNVISRGSIAPTLAALIGWGVGID